MFFFLLAGHAFADFPMQNGPMATCKCRQANDPIQASVPWYYWLAAHSLVHGGVVSAIVKWCGYSMDAAVLMGVLETFVHFLIDYCKCEKMFSILLDQFLHIVCKAFWVALLLKYFAIVT